MSEKENEKTSVNEKPKEDGKTSNEKTPEKGVKKVIRTLYFHEGFWCKELNQSFQIGYYTPKDEKEAAVLAKFAGQEQNHLGPVSKKGI